MDILSLIQEGIHQGFFNGKPISDLSSIIEHDLLVLFRILLANKKFKDSMNIFFDNNSGPALDKNAFNQIGTEVQVRSRGNYSSFSIVDCLNSKSELTQANRMTSNFLAFKLSSELRATWPAIHKKALVHSSLPDKYFLCN